MNARAVFTLRLSAVRLHPFDELNVVATVSHIPSAPRYIPILASTRVGLDLARDGVSCRGPVVRLVDGQVALRGSHRVVRNMIGRRDMT